jgi:anthranilate phosphoribosyltransferase
MLESFNHLLSLVAAGKDLSRAQMTEAMSAVMSGQCTDKQIGLLLTGLHVKGETVAEVAGAAAAMRQHMTTINSQHPKLLDTCGTGGGGSSTFNISTTAALVIAATGVPVAKHGNRSVTSRSGSADVLAQLGVNIEASLTQVERCLDELAICFCFAPRMHPAMRHVASVRKSLGIRTIFNILGPLSNPARATHQLLGTGLPELRPLLASALAMLGTERALVVNGEDGLGEVTLAGTTQVTLVEHGQLQQLQWTPEDFDIEQVSTKTVQNTLQVDGPAASSTMIREVLAGKPGLARDIVVLNAAAGLLAANHCSQPKQAADMAAHAIDRGDAATLLEQLALLSHEGK